METIGQASVAAGFTSTGPAESVTNGARGGPSGGTGGAALGGAGV
jgi:hypothetical protein